MGGENLKMILKKQYSCSIIWAQRRNLKHNIKWKGRINVNLQYLDTLPEIENIYQFELQEGERPIFSTRLSTFGNEKGRMLSSFEFKPKFTLTNKRILIRTKETIG